MSSWHCKATVSQTHTVWKRVVREETVVNPQPRKTKYKSQLQTAIPYMFWRTGLTQLRKQLAYTCVVLSSKPIVNSVISRQIYLLFWPLFALLTPRKSKRCLKPHSYQQVCSRTYYPLLKIFNKTIYLIVICRRRSWIILLDDGGHDVMMTGPRRETQDHPQTVVWNFRQEVSRPRWLMNYHGKFCYH